MRADSRSFVVDVVRRAHSVSILRMAAALAFYALFALPPLVIVVMHVAVWLLDDVQAAQRELQANLGGFPAGLQKTISEIMESVMQPEPQLVLTRLVSYGVIAFAATAGFSHLQWMLNQIWCVGPTRKRKRVLLWSAKRLVGFALVVVSCLVLVGSASLGVALRTIPDQLLTHLPDAWAPNLTAALNDAGFFLLAFVFFSLLFWILPDAKVPWRAAFAGGFATSVLLILGKYLLIIYLNHGWHSRVLGAAGALVATLTSLYAAAGVVLLGGVVSAVVAARRAAAEPGPNGAASGTGRRAPATAE